MNKYKKAVQFLQNLFITNLGEEEKEYMRLAIECLKEKSAQFEYEQIPQVYRDAQQLFNKINGRHKDKDIYEEYCLRIEFQDVAYLVMYYDDGGQVNLEPEWGKDRSEGATELEFGLEDPEFAEISQLIVDTGLSKLGY